MLLYFPVCLEVLQHYCAILKLKKTQFLPQSPEFVGITLGSDGNSPALSKYEAFRKIPRPETWSDLSMLIDMFGFYEKWLSLYEVCIQPWQAIQKEWPDPGMCNIKEEQELMTACWKESDSKLLAELKADVLSGPVLARPDPDRMLKTDWSSSALGLVLVQPDPEHPLTPEFERIFFKEQCCKFNLSLKGPRFRPVEFDSRVTSGPEKSYHSYVGKASAGRWAMHKMRKHLIGRTFMWLTDCSMLKRFFSTADDAPTHMVQRWRAELLQYDFLLEHRPAAMMKECDMLSCYNSVTASWWQEGTPPASMVTVNSMVFDPEHLAEHRQPVCALLKKPDLSRNPSWPFASLIARAVDDHRSILLDASPSAPIQAALEKLVLLTAGIQRIEVPDQWFAEFAHSQVPVVYHWFLAIYPEVNTVPLGQPHHQLHEWILVQLRCALSLACEAALEAVVLIYPHHLPDPVASTVQRAMSTREWQSWQW